MCGTSEQCLGDDIRGRGTHCAVSICANTSLYHWLAVLSYQCLSFPLCAHELPVALAAVSPVLHSSVAELCSSRVRYVDGTAVCCESLRGDTGERSVSDTALHSVTQHLCGVGDSIRGRERDSAVLITHSSSVPHPPTCSIASCPTV